MSFEETKHKGWLFKTVQSVYRKSERYVIVKSTLSDNVESLKVRLETSKGTLGSKWLTANLKKTKIDD